MKGWLKNISFWLTGILLLLTTITQATHLVGGGFKLTYEGGNNYFLELEVLRDCENGQAGYDNQITIGVFEKGTDSIVRYLTLFNPQVRKLVFVGVNCMDIPTGCTEIGVYSQSIYLDPVEFNHPEGYYFSWQRCCRNKIIRNLTSPDSIGMAYYMEIPPPALRNSSPRFNKSPMTLLCRNSDFNINYNVSDPDGDSLRFSLVAPLKGFSDYANYFSTAPGPYPETQWLPRFNQDYQMDASPPLTINPETGEINVTPTQFGVYAISILVEEYRYGIKIGEVRKDMQLTITSCASNTQPKIGNGKRERYITVYPDTRLKEVIEITDPDGDSLYFSFRGNIFAENAKIPPPYATLNPVNGKKSISPVLTWDPQCFHKVNDTFLVEVFVWDNGCPLNKLSTQKIYIVLKPQPRPDPPLVFCLKENPGMPPKISWDYSGIDTSFLRFYWLVIEDPNAGSKKLRYRTGGDTFYVDKESGSSAEGTKCYYFYSENRCGIKGEPGFKICTNTHSDSSVIPTDVALVSVEEAGILVKPPPDVIPRIEAFHIYRKKNNREDPYRYLTSFRNKPGNYYTDTNAAAGNASFCYYLISEDVCGKKSYPGKDFCSIHLSGTSVPFLHTLNWQFRREDVESGQVQRISGENYSTLFSTEKNNYRDNNLNPDQGKYIYRIAGKPVNSDNPEINSLSNEVELIQKPFVHIPNAWSPNGDNLNDKWSLSSWFVKEMEVKIFSRWGNVLFDGPWKYDSVFDFKEGGPYIYLINYSGWDGNNYSEKGIIQPVR